MMTARSPGDTGSTGHSFGGDWTQAKLAVLQGYLAAYTTALKNQPFKKAFIDAFAGTRYRTARLGDDRDENAPLLFPDLADEQPQRLLDGSSRLALRTEPPFDRYIFIEKHPTRCLDLERLKSEFPERAEQIVIRHKEANEEVRSLCDSNWINHRAVLFLDPYGMQVEWETLEAVAETRAIDLWLLFPLGIGVNRLLTKSGDIPVAWRKRLDILLGTTDWYDEFYRVVESQDTLFELPREERIVKASMEAIGSFFVRRLETIFPGVTKKPGVLRNSSNNPLYLFCFAASNKKGAPIALNIANDLLKDLR